MAYSEKSAARLAALHGEIEARKEHEFAAPTYRDTAALAEIRQTVFNQLESEHEHDRDTVEDSIAVLRYLAENYENMGRTACALPLRKKVLELDAELAARFGNSEAFVDENTEEASAVREGIESDYYCALKARNRYGRDECADLREIAAGLLPLDKQIQIEKNVFENYPMLVRDRVELSEEYLAVIDEVERLLEEECGENAHPLETAHIFISFCYRCLHSTTCGGKEVSLLWLSGDVRDYPDKSLYPVWQMQSVHILIRFRFYGLATSFQMLHVR